MEKTQDIGTALHRMFNARAVAVVGASRDPSKRGYRVLETIIAGGYAGRIYPINPGADEILGLRCYPTVNSVGGDVDLAVIIVPASSVPDVLRDVASKGIRGVVLCTGGYRERGRQDLEDELGRVARELGIRILGPNIQGMIYVPNRLSAVFWPEITVPGPVAFITHSGTVTAALCEWAERDQLGVTAGVNLGNQVDICESDLIEYFAHCDDHVRAIALYLESVKDGRRFLEAVRSATREKPVVLLKSGRTPAGRAATASHTASLAGSDEVFAAACRQCGAERADDVESLYDMVKALATVRAPKGNRVLVVTTSGGSGALAADEAERSGLVMPPLPSAYVERIKGFGLAPLAGLSNPLDLTTHSASDFRHCVEAAVEMNVADAYVLAFGDPLPGAADAVRYLVRDVGASVTACYYGGGKVEQRERLAMQADRIAVYPTPERAVRGLGAAVRFAVRSPDRVSDPVSSGEVSPCSPGSN